jgi:hypothetical protein
VQFVSKLLTDVDAWITALVLAALMLAAWGAGWRRGRHLTKDEREAPASKFNDASIAILGLLLAFTFSMALTKHDQRRTMVVSDSNAIGDFYTCASLVKEPERRKLQNVLREYVEHRLTLAKGNLSEGALEGEFGAIQNMQDRMQALVGDAVDDGTPLAVPLVNTLNEVTSNHAARLAAWRDRVPTSIVVLLFVAAIVSMALMGVQQGASGEWHIGATVAFILLVCMVVWVTLDLNQPSRGAITVSQEPLQRLLAGMAK